MKTESFNLTAQSSVEVLDHLKQCLRETSPEQALYLRIASVLSTKISGVSGIAG